MRVAPPAMHSRRDARAARRASRAAPRAHASATAASPHPARGRDEQCVAFDAHVKEPGKSRQA
ncbi:hypothetical protein DF135_31405 [Burkholderia cepacia]|nr:hypothetical protein DF135_31405 [Burkholderia cepacia]